MVSGKPRGRATTIALVESLLRAGVRVRIAVRGPSMAPTLLTGDAVVVEAAAPEALVPGELAVFLLGGRLYVHRFVGWGDDAAGTRHMYFVADAKAMPDPPIPASGLFGRVVAIEHGAPTFDALMPSAHDVAEAGARMHLGLDDLS